MALYAQKANVVTVITEDKIDSYVADGYKIIDETGRIVRETAPDNLETLKEAYISNIAEINMLKAEIARLKDELTRAEKARQAEPKKVETNVTEEPSAPKPKRAPRTKKTVVEE